MKIIFNLVPPGVEAANGWPLKKVDWMSLGVMGAAKTALAERSMPATTNGPARIKKTSIKT